VRAVARLLGRYVPQTDRPNGSDPLSSTSTKAHDREQDLLAAGDKLGRHLFETQLTLRVAAPPGRERQARTQLQHMAAAFGQFTLPRLAVFTIVAKPPRQGFLLSDQELATLWHPATEGVQTAGLRRTESRRLEPPPGIPLKATHPDITELGRITWQDRGDVCGLTLDQRRRHLAIIGKTGVGKTTLLENLLAADIRAGRGVALIDPHGDLADAVLASVPRHRTNDVVVFDAGDRAWPVAFNPLAVRRPEDRPLIASAVYAVLYKLWSDSWGPRLGYVLRYALLALLEIPDSTLVGLVRFLSDEAFRRTIVTRVQDPAARAFWQREFPQWSDKDRREAVVPIQNKAGQFIAHPILRSILGQAHGTLDLRQVMDSGQVLICNLSKGKIGEDGTQLLGSLLVTSLQLAAMSRAAIAESERRDFFCYVDEFQNFATESFATVLSEARKYRFTLTIANQFIEQMEERTAAAVFGNVGNLVAFGCGARDAQFLSEQFAGKVQPDDLIALPRFHAYVRIEGHPNRPFSIQTLPPPVIHPHTQRPGRIREQSRRRYAQPAAIVDRDLSRAFAPAA
jgi:hypothetical protein